MIEPTAKGSSTVNHSSFARKILKSTVRMNDSQNVGLSTTTESVVDMKKVATEQRTTRRKVSFNYNDEVGDSELEESRGEHGHESNSEDNVLLSEDTLINEMEEINKIIKSKIIINLENSMTSLMMRMAMSIINFFI